jgi:hypothetical protein
VRLAARRVKLSRRADKAPTHTAGKCIDTVSLIGQTALEGGASPHVSGLRHSLVCEVSPELSRGGTLLDIGTASAKQIQKDHFGPFI